jgi:hypothetical protein
MQPPGQDQFALFQQFLQAQQAAASALQQQQQQPLLQQQQQHPAFPVPPPPPPLLHQAPPAATPPPPVPSNLDQFAAFQQFMQLVSYGCPFSPAISLNGCLPPSLPWFFTSVLFVAE